jgi:hypothetical protein
MELRTVSYLGDAYHVFDVRVNVCTNTTLELF